MQPASSTRTAASILAGIVGMAGAAWGVANTFEPYRFNAAKSGQWEEEQPAPTPVEDPVLISLPTINEPAEDLAAGSPSGWRSSSNLLAIADSLNTSNTPTSGGGTDDGSNGGNGGNGGNNWVIPGPGRSIDVPGLNGGEDDGDGGLSRPGFLIEPGRDGLVVDCVRDAVDAGEESTETVLAPKPLVEAVAEPDCATEEEAPAEESGGETTEAGESSESDGTAEPGAGEEASSNVAK